LRDLSLPFQRRALPCQRSHVLLTPQTFILTLFQRNVVFKDIFRTLADAIDEASVAVFQLRASRTVSHARDLLQHGVFGDSWLTLRRLLRSLGTVKLTFPHRIDDIYCGEHLVVELIVLLVGLLYLHR